MTMKKFFIFVPVQTMKIFFIFVVSSGHANLVRVATSNIFFLIFRLIRYAYVFFFSLSGVLFTRDYSTTKNETVKQDEIREEPESRIIGAVCVEYGRD